MLGEYKLGSKRARMMESNPYLAVSGGVSGSSAAYNFPVVRLRGLPFSCTELDIYKFFVGLDVVDCLLVNKKGRFSGEAFVVFATPMQAGFALERDRQNMGRRYVEIFRCRKQDYYEAIAAELNAQGGPDNGNPRPKRLLDSSIKDQMEYTEFLKLRGLPYSVTKGDIAEFFQEFSVKEDRVEIVYRADGKATGEAFVEFDSADEAKKAMGKDRKCIGSRYVELYPSTREESKWEKLSGS